MADGQLGIRRNADGTWDILAGDAVHSSSGLANLNAVKVTSQSLTSSQQMNARANIDAPWVKEIPLTPYQFGSTGPGLAVDNTTPIAAMFADAVANGRWIYFPPGDWVTKGASGGNLPLVDSLLIRGAGRQRSRLRIGTSGPSLFQWNTDVSGIRIEDLYIDGASSSAHLFAPGSSGGIHASTFKNLFLNQQVDGKAIWYQDNAASFIHVTFEDVEMQRTATSTQIPFYIRNSGGGANSSQFRQVRLNGLNNTNTVFVHIESTLSQTFASDWQFVGVVGEQNRAGLIKMISACGVTMIGVTDQDATGAYVADVLRFEKNASNLAPRDISLTGCTRRGSTLGAGINEIWVDPAGKNVTLTGCNPTPTSATATISVPVGSTLIGMRLPTTQVAGVPTTKGETMIRVDDYLSGSGAAADTAAWAAAIAECKARARSTSGGIYRGVPRIYASAREWQINSTQLLQSIYGLTIQGDGMDSTVLRVDSGIPIFEVQRCTGLTLEGLTLTCGSSDTGQAAVSGLVENSCGIYMHEDSTDSGISGNTTGIRYTRVRFHGFHRAEMISGNQMCDNITRDQCRYQDNFIDVENLNGQAVNQRVIGGEFVAWLATTETAYNQRLALWSGSVPVTAKANQYQDPAASSGTQQNVTVRDGAVFRVMAGGEFHCDDRVSFVVVKTVFLFASMPTSGATTLYGTTSNVLTYILEGSTGELRVADAVLDSNGYQRVTLIRFEKPHGTSAELGTVSPQVIFKRCRWTVNPSGLDIMHIAGPCSVRWHDTRLAGSTAAGNLRLCHTTGGVTYGVPGDFDGQRAAILTVAITAKDSSNTSQSSPTLGTHNVRQRDFAAGGGLAYDTTSPYVSRSRLRQNNRPVEPVIYQFAQIDGTVVGASSSTVGQTKTFQLGPGAVIKRVGIVLSSVTSGTPSDIVLRFRDSGSTVTYVDLTAKWGTTTTATESIAAGGKVFDGHRRPWAEVHDFAPSDGKLVVEVITKTTAVIVGFVWVEAY